MSLDRYRGRGGGIRESLRQPVRTVNNRKVFMSGIDRLLTERASTEVSLATDDQPAWTHGGHAITAIILAAAGLEAHVGEWLARPANRTRFTHDELRAFKRKAAYEVIKAIVRKRDPSYDFGRADWFLRLQGLHQLRNHVVHYYPEKRDAGTFPLELEPYLKNRTFDPAGDDTMDWTSRLLVKAVAQRALDIAHDAAGQFDSVLEGW